MREITRVIFNQLLDEEHARIIATKGNAVAREMTYFDLVWAMREREMNERQRMRDRLSHRFRSLHTLGGDGVEMMPYPVNEEDEAFRIPALKEHDA